MSAELLEIQPPELKFIFELKKQCSCSVRLVNKSNNHVAFKVKTTSPKKYCVRPNTGVVKPKSTYNFTVTMQAQKVPPPDMICKDKFLVQSTIVPAKTTDEDIDSSMFAKDDGRYVEEKKLRVILVSPPSSPVLSPINGTWKQEPSYEASILKDEVLRKVETFPPPQTGTENVEDSRMENGEIKPEKDIEYKMMKRVEEPAKEVGYKTMQEGEELAYDVEYKTMKKVEEPTNEVEYTTKEKLEEPILKNMEPAKDLEYKRTKDRLDVEEDKTMKNMVDPAKDEGKKMMEDVEEPAYDKECKGMKDVDELKLVKDISEMKSKLNEVESKLCKAEATISKLTEERRWTARERESLQQELDLLRSKRVVRKVRVGFPFLFVCTVALIGVLLGYRLRG